jgi:Conjugative transposon protein TcpC
MVRRSPPPTLDRGTQSGVHANEPELQSTPTPPPRGYDRAPAPWRGAGGRWAVWVLRALVWAVLIIIGVRGVIAIVLNQKTPSPPAASTSAKSGPAAAGTDGSFPSSLAEAYAMQFASVYLNFSQSTASQRAQELAAFLPNGADSQLGWNGAGSLKLQSEQVAGISVRDGQHAVVTLLAQVNGQMMEFGVPIYASGSGMVVNGQPAWLAAPTRVSPPASAAASPDAAAQNALQAQLPAFFQAYANGASATLTRFLVHGVTITGLGGAVSYSSIASLYVPPGGDTRQITVSVVWQIPGASGAAAAQLPMTYDMTVVNQNSNWYVKSIRAADQPVEQQS